LNLANLVVFLEQQPAVDEQTSAMSAWRVSAGGDIRVENVFDFQGELILVRETDGTASLIFMPEQATVIIPLPPDRQAAMHLEFGGIAIVRRSPSTTSTSQWMLEAAVGLSFQGWHPTVQRVLPEQINVEFRADGDRVRLSADRAVAPFDFALPDIDISNDVRIPLGAARIEVTDLFIQLGNDVELGAQIGIGLPADLNNLFGVQEDGSPRLNFFNTFDPADPENTVVNLRFSVGSAGITITPTSSPIRAIRFVETDGVTYWHANLDEFGEVRFQVPVFSYDTAQSSFVANGGFETVRPLSIPLTLFKNLLAATGLQVAADALPDGLPLQEIRILDEQNNFQVEELTRILAATGGLPPEITDALGVIGDRFDQLPEQFREYLNIQIPQSFNFNIAVTPDGGVRLDARVRDGDPPIRLLHPTVQILPLLPIPVPVLNGVTLRGISFGELSGGNLFLLQVDANLDQFDLLTLAASLGLPDDDSLPLPSTRNLTRRLVLNDLFMIIVYQTVIPIPIPLFYDNIGIEYLGLEGVGLKAHAQFPMPSFNLSEVGQILSDLRRFFSDRTFLLDRTMPPRDFNLRFSLDGNYLRLPEYLGGSMLGPGEMGPEISAYDNLAALLNGLKTLSLNELIQAVPLEYRVGNVGVSLASLSSNAGWLITTPDEFRQLTANPASRQQVYQQLQLTDSNQENSLLAILPQMPTQSGQRRNEEGLVVLMKGNWDVANLATFEAAFGLAASSSFGFNTGFRIAGTIQDLIELEIMGRVAINPTRSQPSLPAASSFALAFNGQSDYVRLNNPTTLNITGQITLEAWIRPEASNGIRNIVAHGHSSSPNGEVFLRLNNSNYEVGSWDGQNYLTRAPIPTGDIGNWVHLAGVYDGTTWRLYRNGVQVSAAAAARGAVPVNESWAIGARGTGTERFFQGQIDDVRIWNRARSATEIQTSMTRRLSGNEAGLVGYWFFDESSGGTASDRTIHNHTAMIMGAQWRSPGAPLVANLPDASQNAFQLAGHSHLTLLNQQIFDGDVQIRDDQFWLEGDLNLFPATSPLRVQGQLEGFLSRSTLRLEGNASVDLAGLTLVGARAMISNQRLFLEGTWLGVMTTLLAENQNGTLALRGAVALTLWGLRASLSILADSVRGAIIEGEATGINLLNGAFRLRGANGRANPFLRMQLSPNQAPSLELSGQVQLLGLSSATQISVAENRFSFQTSGRIFNQFGCDLRASGRELSSAPEFRVAGTMRNDLLQYLNTNVAQAIQTAANNASTAFRQAEMDVNQQQAEVNRLNTDINNRRQMLQRQREDANQGVINAQDEVNRAQREVNRLEGEIRRRERDRDGLFVIDPRRIQLEIEIAGLQVALGTARGVLSAAQAVLRTAQRGVDNTPLELDPQLAALISSREIATGALTIAQRTLGELRSGANTAVQVGDFIARNGLSRLLDVRSASFDTDLSTTQGGRIALSLQLVYMNRSQNLTFTFNFNNPSSSVQDLVRVLFQ
jgi:hypothetical protein